MTTKTWRLDDARQTLALSSFASRCPQVIYWGPPLPMDENLDDVAAASQLDVTGGMLDENPDLSLCPEAARSFPGQPGMILRDGDGTPLLPKFTLRDVQAGDGALTINWDTREFLPGDVQGVLTELAVNTAPRSPTVSRHAKTSSSQ